MSKRNRILAPALAFTAALAAAASAQQQPPDPKPGHDLARGPVWIVEKK